MGRPGLDPGTLGLKGTSYLSCGVALVDDVAKLLRIALFPVGIVCLTSRGVWDEIWDGRVTNLRSH